RAVQHAHQKGVIHRDLKPTNVLVAIQDGRPVPKVIDFGVAKALNAKLGDRTVYTELGAVIGTLEYMSPEQAELSALDVDTRADVYALGAMLYELLTGSTPLSRDRLKAAGLAEVLRLIREEEPPKPSTRLSQSKEEIAGLAAKRRTEPGRLTKQVRGELDWIVMKALEKDRNRRYETANGFAMDVQRYLADEPVQACPPSAAYRLKKIVRRNKGPMLAVSLVLLALVAGIVGTAWQALRTERARQAEAERAEGERLAAEGERKAKERAEANFAMADEAVGRFMVAITDDPQLKQPDFDPLRKKLLEPAVPFLQKIADQQSDDPEREADRGAVYIRLINLRLSLDEHEAALRDSEAARDLFVRLNKAFPDVRRYRHGLASCLTTRAIALERLVRLGESEADYRRAVDLKDRLAAEVPGNPAARHDLAESRNNLGALLQLVNRGDEADAEYRKALDILTELTKRYPDEPKYQQKLAKYDNNLGILSLDKREHKAASAAFRRAVDVLEPLVAKFPDESEYRSDLALYHNNLGRALDALGQFSPAEASFGRSADSMAQLADRYPAVTRFRYHQAEYLDKRAGLLTRLSQHAKAEGAIRRALDIRTKLPANYHNWREARWGLAECHNKLGDVLSNQGKFSEAEAAYRQAVDIAAKLASDHPDDKCYVLLASCQLGRGIALANQQKFREAEEAFREAVLTSEKLSADPDSQNMKAACYDGLGNAQMDLNKVPDAKESYLKSLEIKEKLAERFPMVRDYAVGLGAAYCNYAHLLSDSGQPKAALAWYDKAIAQLKPVVDGEKRLVAAREFLRNSYYGRAVAFSRLDRTNEAIPDWESALKLDDSNRRHVLQSGLAHSKLLKSRKDKNAAGCLAAAAEYEAVKGTDAGWLYDAACNRALCAAVIPDDPKTPPADAAGLAKEQADLAMAWLHKAVAAGFSNASHMKQDKDLDALRERADFKKLLAELENKKK
ncbi:MAG TPA: serine/threonine-protein kinase, partial [Fimbriiglobus sp.]|nr:serine/threonine-protein kinase [Fimbriiglobus sp.]